ncbi:hypothetical protein QZH41_015331 [Actinostola sp. cb2023]|nr:hypothetical protein QZH41_015331 [Actinostola sp. cb2023]
MIKNELVVCLENSLGGLQKIWDEIGISDEQKEERTQVVLKHLQTLLQQMVEEEQDLKKTLLRNVKTCRDDVKKLSEELGIECPTFQQGISILKLENDLRMKVDELKLEKHERTKVLKALRDQEEILCKRLCLPVHNFGQQVVIPNKEQLRELQANIDYVQKELVKRSEQFKKMKSTVTELWRELEDTPKTTLEKEIVASDADSNFVLSAANLETLKVLELELDHQKTINMVTAKQLRDNVQSLWTKLEVPENNYKPFLARWHGFKPSTLTAFKEEKQRLEALKLQHMQKFIEGLRKELISLWEKCYYGAAQRDSFSPINDTNYTEELLTMHEHQVEVMKSYYEQNKHLFKMVEKRTTMFAKMEEYEVKQNDVNRFSNRGGALLKECRARKIIEKELPKLEKELREEVTKWEAENEQKFLIHGKQFIELMEEQWENMKLQKEQIKLERHKRNQDIMKKELLYGSNPVTPTKRRFIGTPSKTPTKQKRTDTTATPSKFGMSAFQSPKFTRAAGLPPIGSTTKKQSKVSRLVNRAKVTPKRASARLKAKRQVLGENSYVMFSPKGKKTLNGSIAMVTGSKTTSVRNVSLLSCMDYNDFAVSL